ncbi:MAG: FmdB family zinc ribbon protein [Actinomycetes bacterium]
MPTYQYACTECGHSFEEQQSFSDAALTECPTCGGRLRKVFNSVGIVFKGSGFYRNDSREGAKKAATVPAKDSAGAKDGATSGAGGTEKKSEGKPAAASTSSSSSGSGSTSGGSSSTAGSAA